MIVKIDYRESQRLCGAIQFYRKKHKIIIEELPIGDFIFMENNTSVVFEYKKFNDFINSVKEGRLFDQALRQYNNFKYHFIILELSKDNNKNNSILNNEKYCETIARLNTFTTVLISSSSTLSFRLMEKQAELILENNPLKKRPPEKLDNVAYNYLLLIKGIDKIKAHTICKHLKLKTFEDLRKITTKKLIKVPGIGPLTAQRIITSIKLN